MAFEMIEKYRIYICQKGDTKKTIDIEEGSFLFETDSGFRYIFNGSSWVLYAEPTSFLNTVLTSKSSTNLVSVDTTVNGVEIASSNINRAKISIQNTGTNAVLLAFDENVSSTNYSIVLAADNGIRLGEGGIFESSSWKGQVKGITEVDTTTVSVFEEVYT